MTKKFNQGELTGFNCEPEVVVLEINVKHKMVNEFSTTEISLRISNCKFFLNRVSLKKRQMTYTD